MATNRELEEQLSDEKETTKALRAKLQSLRDLLDELVEQGLVNAAAVQMIERVRGPVGS